MSREIARRILVRILIIAVSSVLCFSLVEIATRMLIVNDRLDVEPRRAFLQDGNTAHDLLTSVYDDQCSWVERFRPSLRFGYVYRSEGPCTMSIADKNGFHNRVPFPDRRDPSKFSILVLGGSVAEAMAANDMTDSYLGRIFRAKYSGPKGESIDVYSGALGGWAVPTQELVLMTFMQGFDAVISIDGANELSHLQDQNWIGQPDPLAFAFRFDHTRLFGIEFSLVKAMRRARGIWPLHGSYAWAGLLSLIEIQAQDELFSNIYSEGRIGRTAQLSFTPNLTANEIVDQNIDRYARHAKNIHAMSRANGLLSAHFIQPIAAIAKTLTTEEKRFDNYQNLEFYRRLESKTLEALKGQATFSLVDIFTNRTETIYADRVHPMVVGPGRKSLGYEALAEAVVDQTSKIWHLKKTPSSQR